MSGADEKNDFAVYVSKKNGLIVPYNAEYQYTTEKNPYEDYMCYVNETMSDEEILDKINHYINLPINEYNNIINNSYLITKNNFIYENANDKFNKIMEFIINENNES